MANHPAGGARGDRGIRQAGDRGQIDRVGELADQAGVGPPDLPFLSFDDVEPTWAAVQDRRPS